MVVSPERLADIESFLRSVGDERRRCESPVEVMFYNAWRDLGCMRLPHMEVAVQTGKYRIDFAIRRFSDALCQIPASFKLALAAPRFGIEVDGRAWHSARDVFTTDRIRQRELEIAGWRFVRFSADEVTADPIRCVQQADASFRSIYALPEPCFY